MTTIRTNITGTYLPCVECKAPIIFVCGKGQQPITVSGNAGAPRITPHSEDCSLRGGQANSAPVTADLTVGFTMPWLNEIGE